MASFMNRHMPSVAGSSQFASKRLIPSSPEYCSCFANSLFHSRELATALSAAAAHAEPAKNVVLVHGAFADGSGCKAVAEILAADGYTLLSTLIDTLGLFIEVV